MSEREGLPSGEYNMPPGVNTRDIPGNDNRVECCSCGRKFIPNEDEDLCPRCEARSQNEDDQHYEQ